MSKSGCCTRTKRCLARSVASKSPLVSTRMPLGSSKSTVYVRIIDGTTYLILTTSKRTLTPRFLSSSALVASSPDLKPCLKPAAYRLPRANHEGRALIAIEHRDVHSTPDGEEHDDTERDEGLRRIHRGNHHECHADHRRADCEHAGDDGLND